MRLTLRDLIFALTLSLIAISIPFEVLNTGRQQDFNIYSNYFNNFTISKLDIYPNSSLLQYLQMELLWDVIIRWLTSFMGDASYALLVASLATYFIWSLYLASRVPTYISIIFLLNVISIDIASSMIRIGLSWAIVILGFSLGKNKLKYIAYVSAVLIHTTAFGLLFCSIPYYLINKYDLKKSIAIISIIAIPLLLGISLTLTNEFVLGGMGDKHVGKLHLAGSGSWLIAAYFIGLLAFQFDSNIDYIKKHSITMSILIWYLWMNLYIPWSFRIWAASIPLIAFAVWDLKERVKILMILMWCLFSLYLYYLRVADFGSIK